MRDIPTLLILLIASASAWGDTLVLRDGTTLHGRLIQQDATAVVFESGSNGVSLRQSVPRDRISSLQTEQRPAGTAFLEVPMVGVVGAQITAAGVEEASAAARKSGATDIVFLFDSPGGELTEMGRIIDALARNKDLRTIAFIKDANSAAAIIAAACSTIVMHPQGRCGAAVPFIVTQPGTPVAVNEKLTSAVRAIARNAATLGHRSPDLFMAMIDPDTELWSSEPVESGGPPTITLSKPEKGGVCIKPRGKVLTLTTDEAVRYGLAAGTARTMKDLSLLLHITSWTNCGDEGQEIMRRTGAARVAQLQDEARVGQKTGALATLAQRVKDSQSMLADYQKRLASLESALTAQLQKLDSDYADKLRSISNGEGDTLRRVRLREQHDSDVAQAKHDAASARSPISDAIVTLQQRLRDDQQRAKELQQ